MAKVKRNSASANATGATVDYEAELWRMADDDEPFEEKMARLVAQLHEQQTQAQKLDAAITANLKELGYGV